MIVRRRIVPCLAFLAVATILTGTARAQKPGPGAHETLPGTYSPDQIKRALQGFGGALPDLPPDILNLFKDQMEQRAKKPIDERQLKQALEMMQNNPEFRRQVEEMGRRMKDNKGAMPLEERQRLERLLPDIQKAMPQNNGGLQPPMLNDPKLAPPAPIDPKNNFNPPPPFPPQPNPGPGPGPRPMPGQNPDPLGKLDPNGRNPLDGPQTPREKAAHAAASLWERNIGPLDETPAVKKALFELIEGSEDFDLTGPDGKSLWDDLALEKGDATSLSEMLDGLSLTESWSLSNFELPDWKLFGDRDGPDVDNGGGAQRESWWSRNFGRRNTTQVDPKPPSSGWNLNLGMPGVQGSWWPVVILAILLFGGLLVWRFWGVKWSRQRALGLYGPGWPLDPRRITTREHVVIAFEYLSVLICGPSAKTWTHNTIAGALADLATTHGEVAVMLARLYELARYAPLNEPLTTAELAEARRLVCGLAGLEHE